MKAIQIILGVIGLAIAPFAISADNDPPARVGRISHVAGEVDFRSRYQDEPEEARLNYPVTGGNVLATGRDGRAEIRIGSTAIRAGGDTEMEFERLDDERIRLRLLQGSSALRVRNAEDAANIEIITPQGRMQPLEPGRYRIDTQGGSDRTRISVFNGKARFDGPGSALTVRQGDSLDVEGWETQRIREGEVRADEFDDWALARDRGDDALPPTRYVSDETTGYEDLDRYGDWREYPDYGAVWMPRGVAADWAPYRYGRWVWVEPWGWTWVDDMPWGFAPFHYGRWALVGGTWGWVPGTYVRRPVYAPALVAWIGTPGVGFSISIGSTPEVGWFPLAPREVYVPVYRHSPTYVRLVNVTHVHDVSRIHDRHGKYAYRDLPRAVTVVPARVVAEHRPVRRDIVRIKESRDIAALPLATGGPALKPVPRASRTASPGEREADKRRQERWQERRQERDGQRAVVEQRTRDRPPAADGPRRTDERPDGRSAGDRQRSEAAAPVSGEAFRRGADGRQGSVPQARDREERMRAERGAQEREAAEQQRRNAPDRPSAERQRDETQARQAAERQRRETEERQAGERQRREAEQRQAGEQQRREGEQRQSAERQRRETEERQAVERQRREGEQRQAGERQRRETEARQAGERQRRETEQRQAAERQRQESEQRQAAERQRSDAKARQAADEERRRSQQVDQARREAQQQWRRTEDRQRAPQVQESGGAPVAQPFPPPAARQEDRAVRQERELRRAAGMGGEAPRSAERQRPQEPQRQPEPRKAQDRRDGGGPDRGKAGEGGPPPGR